MSLKRFIAVTTFILFSYFTYGIFLANHEFKILSTDIAIDNKNEFYDYKGLLHVQFDKSLEPLKHMRLIEEAKEEGVHFISFSNLNWFSSPKELEGYYGNVLVFFDGKYSFSNSNFLILDSKTNAFFTSPGQAQLFLSDALSNTSNEKEKGIFIITHPIKPGSTWREPFPKGINGIELFNLRAIWQNAWVRSNTYVFWTLLIYPFHQDLALIRLFENPAPMEIKQWDSLNEKKKTIAIAGVDATPTLNVPGIGRIPSYKTLFSILSNHVLLKSELTGNAKKDKEKISNALRKGQFYMSVDLLGNPKGFVNYIEAENGEKLLPGSETKLKKQLTLKIKLPTKPRAMFETLVYKEGQVFLRSNSQTTEMRIHQKGTYRVVVRAKVDLAWPDKDRWIPWIYSNPFYVN